jgi:hypothetical protein
MKTEIKTQHTPGPWKFTKSYPQMGDSSEVYGVMIPCRPTVWINPVAGNDPIDRKNALLIAAAPDLIAALKLCKATLGALGGHLASERDEAIEAARAAIEKAQPTK